MDSIRRDIFKAIHEGKWLSIQYRNKDGNVTRYWIGILDLNLSTRSLKVEGLHLGKYSLMQLDKIFIDSILSSQVIEGSYCPINKVLVRSICFHPYRYKGLFEHIANLKVLNYLEECNRMDTTPYKADYGLIKYLDRESFRDNIYSLSDEQFKAVVKDFQVKAEINQDQNPGKKLMLQQLGMNVLSIHTSGGLYVLAYRKLALDVKGKCLRPDPDITICTEFTLDGRKESIRRYLDAEDYELLKNFKQNQERIKDIITNSRCGLSMVDDMPYIIGLGRDIAVDLHREYGAVIKMYQDKEVPVPAKAFFNEKTALFSSCNNHPIDGVVEKLTSLTYEKKVIPLPIVCLGNHEKVKESLTYIRKLYEQTKQVTVYGATLDRNRKARAEGAFGPA